MLDAVACARTSLAASPSVGVSALREAALLVRLILVAEVAAQSVLVM